MEDVINKENVERLVGSYSQFRKRSTVNAVEVKEKCRVDTVNGIETAHKGDYICPVPGKGIAVVLGWQFEEEYLLANVSEHSDTDIKE